MSDINFNSSQNSIINSLIQLFGSTKETPSHLDIENAAKMIAPLVQYTGPIEPVVNQVMVDIVTSMGVGVSLVDPEAKHDEKWVYTNNKINWIYSDSYEKYLRGQGWNNNLIQSLSDVSKNIVGLLQDPTSDGTWDRRGLVIGNVQSGKTANYLSVVSRAADAGYKFIIVIAGIHNNLRKQTQERVDEGFVGKSSDPNNRCLIGVGHNKYPHPATLTNIYQDFNKSTAGHSGWELNDFSKPIILVIKKNVSTLKSLFTWLKEMNVKGDGKISDIPMLMIDDEADNASINTNKEDINPTQTNFMIRKIVGLFEKSCYVGYTATPFANIFINPESYDSEAYNELFPKDFIYCLDSPTTYFGPEKVFINDASSERILYKITDAEKYISLTHTKDDQISELPPSLYQAINSFILARCIRNLRGHENKHCSMMVNVSRFVDIQNTVKSLINHYIKSVEESILANYKMPENISQNNKHMTSLYQVFTKEFIGCEFDWEKIKENLYGVFKTFKSVVINGKSQDNLDYAEYKNEGLTVIAVGGLSLSRGLTIEGLCISYMYRNTKMYDTLMQMGRWFGYRSGYEDLCRVFLSEDSIEWYAHIATATEELRSQVKQMRRDKLSPKQFGLYVTKHPDQLLITAVNKMRHGEDLIIQQNYCGELIESDILHFSSTINERNKSLITDYWEKGFEKGTNCIENTAKGWFIKDVDTEIIENFIQEFQAHSKFSFKKSNALKYLREISDICSKSDVLLISKDSNNIAPYDFTLRPQDRKSSKLFKEEKYWQTAKSRVASKLDERLGLTPIQLELAENNSKDKSISDRDYRNVRGKPLLMIHMLDLHENDGDGGEKIHSVPAFGISFPTHLYTKSIEIKVNKVWLESFMGSVYDTPEEEEDWDE